MLANTFSNIRINLNIEVSKAASLIINAKKKTSANKNHFVLLNDEKIFYHLLLGLLNRKKVIFQNTIYKSVPMNLFFDFLCDI